MDWSWKGKGVFLQDLFVILKLFNGTSLFFFFNNNAVTE